MDKKSEVIGDCYTKPIVYNSDEASEIMRKEADSQASESYSRPGIYSADDPGRGRNSHPRS